jgi:ABC-type protease/lipase transport system fused ATPase/permease subunit
MIVSAPLMIYGIGFTTSPHHFELAIVIAAVYLVCSAFFNRWVYRKTMRRARQLDMSGTLGRPT